MKTNPENSLESLKEVLPVLEGVEDWTEENIHDALFDLIGKLGVKNGIVLWPLGVAVSGKAFTPGGGVEISYLIGKEDTLARIRKGIGRNNFQTSGKSDLCKAEIAPLPYKLHRYIAFKQINNSTAEHFEYLLL